MMFRKIILILMNLISSINCNECYCRKYAELEIKDVASIKKSDLPADFSDEAFKVVDEFIRKTNDLDNEILLYFDYITGEILKCKIGSKTNVKLKVEDEEFARKHISSIHNHTKDMYSPPSDKNFGIFSREWEDYELISGIDGLWILKGKLKDDKLTFELKTNSQILFRMVLDYHSKIFSDDKERNDKIDKEYGKLLSNYINNKNKKEIQLSKREYNNDS